MFTESPRILDFDRSASWLGMGGTYNRCGLSWMANPGFCREM